MTATASVTPSPAVDARPRPPTRSWLFSRRTWLELVYVLIDVPVTVAFFTTIVALLAAGVGSAVVYVGIPILLAGLFVARAAGATGRALAGTLLGRQVAPPGALRRRHPGLGGLVRDHVTDAVAWRALAYSAIKLVLAPVVLAIAVACYSGLGMICYPIWRPFLPLQQAADGSWHRGAQLWNDMFLDTWPAMAIYVGVGALLVAVAPFAVRGMLAADRHLIAGLLAARVGRCEP